MGRLRKYVMEIEMGVDAELQQAESAEMESPKRKVIRRESEETQDYVCETLTISQEEAEELAFCAECCQRAARSHLFLRQSLQRKKRSDTGNLLQLSLKNVKKLEHQMCVSSATLSGGYSKVNRG